MPGKANPMGVLEHKKLATHFLASKTKNRKHNELHNSLVEKKKIYYFFKKGVSFFRY